MQDIFKDYYQTKMALEILTKEVEDKKAKILEILATVPDRKTETDFAKFSVRVTPVYTFSKVVTEAEEQIKIQKKGIDFMKDDEIKRGVAVLDHSTEILVMNKK